MTSWREIWEPSMKVEPNFPRSFLAFPSICISSFVMAHCSSSPSGDRAPVWAQGGEQVWKQEAQFAIKLGINGMTHKTWLQASNCDELHVKIVCMVVNATKNPISFIKFPYTAALVSLGLNAELGLQQMLFKPTEIVVMIL
ncbi:hypothetical protein MRB53_021776 [Persea americana]|uniref:Uncharacterized protein n=1 Tax=Persea americana TaxID=3435 RepID=A0ACC2L607_PERAE|nr:hypothetical protein MRB53_021776 [Persea americana]